MKKKNNMKKKNVVNNFATKMLSVPKYEEVPEFTISPNYGRMPCAEGHIRCITVSEKIRIENKSIILNKN